MGGVRGGKSAEKSFAMRLGILGRGITDVSGWFWRIFGPLDPNLGPWSPVETRTRPAGGFVELAVLGGFGVKNHPKKKFRNVFGGTWEGY